MRSVGAVVVAVLGLGACLAGCSSDGRETIDVYAASSLTDAFADLEDQYEALDPDVDVRLNLAGSTTLVTQIIEGAPADVVATADEATMRRLAAEVGLPEPPTTLATNRLVLAVAPGNPFDIDSLTDLADTELAIAICAPEVPCGAATLRAAEAAGVIIAADTVETNVRAVRARVELGEADVAVVYATDTRTDRVDRVDFDGSETVSYPIAVLDTDAGAEDFVAFVLGPDGRAVLAEYGFGAPA